MSPLSSRWLASLSLSLVTLSVPLVVTMAADTASVTAQPISQQAISQQRISQQPMMGGTRSRLQRVRFAPGANAATIKGGVVNGTRDRYLLGAQKGQTMSIRIVSLEDNAVFDVIAPPNDVGQRRTLKEEGVTWSNTLPETGDYQIVVGSTRGNASYRLQVTIK